MTNSSIGMIFVNGTVLCVIVVLAVCKARHCAQMDMSKDISSHEIESGNSMSQQENSLRLRRQRRSEERIEHQRILEDEPTKCISNSDCQQGYWCGGLASGRYSLTCIPFQPIGQTCSPSIGQLMCDPITSFCNAPQNCMTDLLADEKLQLGTCVAFGSDCRLDSDCHELSFCDPLFQKCRPKVGLEACCDDDIQCKSGLRCELFSHDYSFSLCRRSHTATDLTSIGQA